MPNAVLDTVTGVGYVKRWGDADFSATVVAGEVQVALNDGQVKPDPSEPNRHYTVTAGVFVLLNAADQATADTAFQATLLGAQVVTHVFQTIADLPLPPPISGAFVGVVNGPGGLPGLALSTNTHWILFAADAQVPP